VKRAMKLLHVLGAVGLAGALAAHLVLLASAPAPLAAGEYAAVRAGILAIGTWVLLPSLLLVLTSGLLAIAVHGPFREARWVWIKAVLGLAMFEGTLAVVQGPSQRAAELAQKAAAGTVEPAVLADTVSGEWRGVAFILVLALANVILGVLRPRLARRRQPAAGLAGSRQSAGGADA